MNTLDSAKAYLVGGGIASLSAAVLLIRDAGFLGTNIHILEELEVAGGALDGSGDAVKGYVTRGGRMFTEETYLCLWNVLQSVPFLDDPAKSVKDQVWAFNDQWRGDSHARLINRHRHILNAKDLGFSLHERLELMRLLATPERSLGTQRIEDCFSPHFPDFHDLRHLVDWTQVVFRAAATCTSPPLSSGGGPQSSSCEQTIRSERAPAKNSWERCGWCTDLSSARAKPMVGSGNFWPSPNRGRIRSAHRLVTSDFSLARICLCLRPSVCQVSGLARQSPVATCILTADYSFFQDIEDENGL